MPVTLTLAEFAADVRAGDGVNDPPEPLAGVLQRYLDSATAIVGVYVPSTVPDAILNTAASRIAGYMFDSPHAAAGMRFSAIITNSGAADVMRLWRPIDIYLDGDDPTLGAITLDGAGSSPTGPAPAVRFFTLAFANPGAVLSDVAAMTAQQFMDASVEVLGLTSRQISTAAPIYAWQQSFHYNPTGFQWVGIAVAAGDDTPTQFRLKQSTDVYPWPNNWRQSSGQAIAGGVAYDVYWWPQVSTAFPETTLFEWPYA